MKKILITVAHYFSFAPKKGVYGSYQGDPEPRVTALRDLIVALHRHFSGGDRVARIGAERNLPANGQHRWSVDIVVCGLEGFNVVDLLGLPRGLFRFEAVRCHPMMIGFECHRVLAENAGRYDVYGYMEDDLAIEDPLFFDKVTWFAEATGSRNVLLPHRYEFDLYDAHGKYYIDADFDIDGLVYPPTMPELSAPFLGGTVHFRMARNPHSGCFFLTGEQMQAWMASGNFLDRDISWVGPLEAAATLGMIKNFKVFKPAVGNAAFLELRHPGTRLTKALSLDPVE